MGPKKMIPLWILMCIPLISLSQNSEPSPKEKQQLRLQEFLKRTQFVIEAQGGLSFAVFPNKVISETDPNLIFSEPTRASNLYGHYRLVAGGYFKKNLIEVAFENTLDLVSFGILPDDPQQPIMYYNSPANYYSISLGYHRKLMLSNISRFNVYPGIYFGAAIGSRFEMQPGETILRDTMHFNVNYSIANRFVPVVIPSIKVELNITHYLALTYNASLMVGILPSRKASIEYYSDSNPNDITAVEVQSSFLNLSMSMGLRFRMFYTGTVKKVQAVYPKPGKGN